MNATPNKEQPMSKRKIGAAEAITQTDNPHYNGYALAFFCKAKQGNKFPDLDKAMELYSVVLGIVQDYHDQPLKGDRLAEAALTKAGMNEEQALAINHAAYTYLTGSEFDEDLTIGKELLKARAYEKKVVPWTSSARDGLQELLRAELAELPSTLKGLEPKDRIAALCKLLPYALPRLGNVELNDPSKSIW
jgi:hypothetical protein